MSQSELMTRVLGILRIPMIAIDCHALTISLRKSPGLSLTQILRHAICHKMVRYKRHPRLSDINEVYKHLLNSGAQCRRYRSRRCAIFTGGQHVPAGGKATYSKYGHPATVVQAPFVSCLLYHPSPRPVAFAEGTGRVSAVPV